MSDPINIQQAVNYLNFSFSKAIQKFGSKNTRGTDLHQFQTDFCYIIDEIQRGPKYITSKKISEANNLIEEVNQFVVDSKEK